MQAIASSQPPPSVKPLSAAITGLPSASMASNTRCPAVACALPWAGDCTASSLMSAPATKAFSPAPVSTMARTDASARSVAITCPSSAIVGALSAFIFAGRLMVTTATAPSRSSSRFS